MNKRILIVSISLLLITSSLCLCSCGENETAMEYRAELISLAEQNLDVYDEEAWHMAYDNLVEEYGEEEAGKIMDIVGAYGREVRNYISPSITPYLDLE